MSKAVVALGLVMAGMFGLYLGIEYSGWVCLLACWW